MKNNLLYIVGTDTGIGKTVFSLFLMRYFYSKGFKPFYFKPFQTGCLSPIDPESDARFIYEHVPELKGKDPFISVGYCFKNPKAPYFSARNEGKGINVEWVKEIIEERKKQYDPIIIEGSGGLLVPVTKDILIVDTIKIFNASPILVAKAGLGTINHTLMSLEILEKRGIRPISVILMDKEQTPKDMIRENMEAIEMFSGIKVIGVIKRLEKFYNFDQDIFLLLNKIFNQ